MILKLNQISEGNSAWSKKINKFEIKQKLSAEDDRKEKAFIKVILLSFLKY